MSELGHSLQVRPRLLVHKCPLCINTDRKFWALGFVAMCHNRTRSNLVLLSIVAEAFRMSDGGGKEAATIGYLCPIEFERKPGFA
jgi:hypothetical protein